MPRDVVNLLAADDGDVRPQFINHGIHVLPDQGVGVVQRPAAGAKFLGMFLVRALVHPFDFLFRVEATAHDPRVGLDQAALADGFRRNLDVRAGHDVDLQRAVRQRALR